MRRTTSRAKGIGIIGLVALAVGGVLMGTALTAGASPTSGENGCTKPTCSITVNGTQPFTSGAPVQVTGSDFDASVKGAVLECNMDSTAPTISVTFEGAKLGDQSVGCTGPQATFTKSSKTGTIFAGTSANETSATLTLGPPAVGTDSGGGQAATDAASYPCPPTQAEVTAGISCAYVWVDAKGESAYSDITFTTPYTTTTTTTTTTTNPGCPQVARSETDAAPLTGTVTVTPATCLQGGTAVVVTGSGLNTSDLGSILECNTTPGEPTAWNTTADQAVPVGCLDPTNNLFSTSASGVIAPPASLKGGVAVGTLGPPFTASDEGTPPAGTPTADLPTDSNAQAAIDAANYPCPPTAAQVAAGDTCAIVFGDLAPKGPPAGTADQIVVPITWNTADLTPNGTGGPKSVTSAKTSTTTTKPATKAASSSLAFTGTGPGLWWLGAVGALLIVLGGLMLAVVEGPRRFLRFAHYHGGRRGNDRNSTS